MESWPTLVLGDLFDMLLPMLSIYQEYVRNHHYSLQTLAECKQRPSFNRLLALCEQKPLCTGRTLEWFLTCPMHRVPSYIITLHELLALTPHDHVERNALEYAQGVLEELSTVMHDEVSETENIRKNLFIERQIVEGCDMLLDVNQIFIRQGNLIQVTEKVKGKTFGGISLKSSSETRKESVRRCFLFSGYLLITSRSSSGRLHLAKNGSVLPLSNTSLVEDYIEEEVEHATGVRPAQEIECADLTFKLIVKTKDKSDVLPQTITLMAPSAHEKAAWTSDISQCIENLTLAEDTDSVSVTCKQSMAGVRNDPRLFTDDHNIKYCKALNSCRLPKIRYGSLERLLERLLDVRFLSIDFLNTFLITYRVFTSAATLLDTLVQFYYTRSTKDGCPLSDGYQTNSKKTRSVSLPTEALSYIADRRLGTTLRSANHDKPFSQNISITVSHEKMSNNHHLIPENEELDARELQVSGRLCPNLYQSYRRHSSPSALGETTGFEFPVNSVDALETPTDDMPDFTKTTKYPSPGHASPTLPRGCFPRVRAQSTSYEVGPALQEQAVSPSSETSLFSSPPNDSIPGDVFQLESPPRRRARSRTASDGVCPVAPFSTSTIDEYQFDDVISSSQHTAPSSPIKGISLNSDDQQSNVEKVKRKMLGAHETGSYSPTPPKSLFNRRRGSNTDGKDTSFLDGIKRPPSPCRLHTSGKEAEEKRSGMSNSPKLTIRIPHSPSPLNSPRSPRSPISPSTNAGVVVTSSRPSRRRSSISSAAAAFAAATAGASPSTGIHSNNGNSQHSSRFRFGHTVRHMLSNDTHLATMRVLTVLRHWVTKHAEDFKADFHLREHLIIFMEEILNYEGSTNLEQKFANAILRTLERKQEDTATTKLKILLSSQHTDIDPLSFEKFSAPQLAEQLTLIEHILFACIPSHEFLNLSWMKPNKKERAPNILRVSQRFNEMSRLVATEILKRQSPAARATIIEKWATIADICRNLNNFNSVLEITSAFSSSAIYRIKKTWEKVSKQTRSLIDKLQKIVSSEGRFKNLRSALRCADPPCIPYLGYNLTDLNFIEDGTANCNEDGLINFSKMRMIAEVIQEIRHYQHNSYTIEYNEKVANYLLCTEFLMDEEQLYRTSLMLEPRKTAGGSTRLKQPSESEKNQNN